MRMKHGSQILLTAISSATRPQGDAIASDYAPLAEAAGIQQASLPPRPSIEQLIGAALAEHADCICDEGAEAQPPIVVAPGEEAPRVPLELAGDALWPPLGRLESRSLTGAAAAEYGNSFTTTGGVFASRWHALVHPGQRPTTWAALHEDWIGRRQRETASQMTLDGRSGVEPKPASVSTP